MKSQENFLPPPTEIEKAEKEIVPQSPEVEIEVEISNEEFEQYATATETQIEQQTSEILPVAEQRIESSAKSMNVSPETMGAVRQEQGLDAQLNEIQAEASQLANEARLDIEKITGNEETISNQDRDIDNSRNIELLSQNRNVDTAKVFCHVDTEGLSKDKKREIYDNPENWDESRRSLHEKLQKENIQKALDLSRRLEKENPKIPPPTIFALRGSPGAGKTTSLRKGNEMFRGILDENGQPSGSLAPDVFKGPLKEEGNLSSGQVHAESTMLGRIVKNEVSNTNTSVVFDKLMNENADIEEMIESAKETNRKIAIMDIDVPLELSAIRVLGREKGGADPNITFEGVEQGFRGIRQNREAEHKILDSNPQFVSGYVLMAYDKESRQSVEVAMWDDETGNVRIVEGRENLAKQSIEDPEEEIERIKNTVITEEYIKNFTTTYFDEKSQPFVEKTAQTLRQYLGKTINMALDEKAQ